MTWLISDLSEFQYSVVPAALCSDGDCGFSIMEDTRLADPIKIATSKTAAMFNRSREECTLAQILLAPFSEGVDPSKECSQCGKAVKTIDLITNSPPEYLILQGTWSVDDVVPSIKNLEYSAFPSELRLLSYVVAGVIEQVDTAHLIAHLFFYVKGHEQPAGTVTYDDRNPNLKIHHGVPSTRHLIGRAVTIILRKL